MTRTRPLGFTATDLPLPELLAARLDGDVFGLNLTFFAIDEFDGPELRAASLRGHTPAHLTAERDTAAWIWGARSTPPFPLEFCSGTGSRGRPGGPLAMIVREVVIEPEETVELAGLAVTGAMRTLLDLLRFSADFDAGVAIRLAALAGTDRAACEAALVRRKNLPFRRRAFARLEKVFGAADRPA